MTDDEFTAYLKTRGRADEISGLIDKLGFTRDFVITKILNSNASLSVAQIAMLWMGMPNKHDRKKTRQLVDALTEVGLLKPDAQAEMWSSTVA